MNQKLIIYFVVLIMPCFAVAQKLLKYPQIGKPCPEFSFAIEHHPKTNVSLKDFKGKWLILDFWGEYCGGCIKSFPEINSVQRQFKDKVQFVLVSYTYKKDSKRAKALYEKLRSTLDLEIPVTYDQKIVNEWGIMGLPTSVVINPDGVVKYITGSLSETDMLKVVNDEKVVLPRHYLEHDIQPSESYNLDLPLLTFNNGASDSSFIHRSVLAQWKESMPGYSLYVKPNRLEAFKMDLKSLYRLAYFGYRSWTIDSALYGVYRYDPILEIRDSSLFQSNIDLGINCFSYSVSFPVDSTLTERETNLYQISKNHRLKGRIQRDLKNFFNYDCKVETRVMPCYNLVADDDAPSKLRTKGGKPTVQKQNGVTVLQNVSPDRVVAYLYNSAGSPKRSVPIYNKTGILENIDIEINAIYFQDWLREIGKYGLRLVPAHAEMKVLIISDSK